MSAPILPLGRAYVLSPHSRGGTLEDVWPTLFFGAERAAEMKRKITRLRWARSLLERALSEAERVIASPPLLPIEAAGSRHEFYSPRTGEHLVHDINYPEQYLDPLDGSWISEAEKRRAWVLLTHERTARQMRNIGALYWLTGDERFAAWVAQGICAAVEMFRRAEEHSPLEPGAAYNVFLYDAQLLMLLAGAYSFTRESNAYAPRAHDAILNHIFAPEVPRLMSQAEKRGPHNIAAYQCAAAAVAGRICNRPEWIEAALRSPHIGLEAHLRHGVRVDENGRHDGFWFEGTQFYHFYAVCPLIVLFELMRERDPNKAAELREPFVALFEAPMRLADERFRLPTLGDLGAPKVMNLRLYTHLYEYAAGQLDATRFGSFLGALYGGEPRSNFAALAYGPDALRTRRTWFVPKSDHLSAAGLAILRSKQLSLYFRCGRHGAGHDHPDKLQIILHAMGEILSPDPGTAGYSLREYLQYYRSTFAHNTLMVDEKNQNKVTRARLTLLNPLCAEGVVEDAYEGIVLRRKVTLAPRSVILEDEGVSEAEHRFGWVFHAYGSMSFEAQPGPALDLPPLPDEIPFSFFTARHSFACEGTLRVNWHVRDGLYLTLSIRSDGPFEAVLGRTPGNPIPHDLGTVFLRAPGKRRMFFADLAVHDGS